MDDESWSADTKIGCGILGLIFGAVMGLGFWVVIELVNWITSK